MNDPDWKYLNDFKRKHIDKAPGSRKSWNDIHLPYRARGAGWTNSTAATTLAICFWAWEHGYAFMTEVPMMGGGPGVLGGRRADVVIPEMYETQVIEIHDSEEPASIEAKRREYEAEGLTFVAVPADPSQALKLLAARNKLEAPTSALKKPIDQWNSRAYTTP